MRRNAFVLVILLLCLVIGACSSPAETPTAPPATSTPEPIIEEPTPEPVVEPANLVFWHQYDKKNAELIDKFVAEFNEQNPDIQVEAVVQPSYDEYKTLLKTSIVGGNTPDIATVDLVWVPEYIAADTLVSLDSFFADDQEFDLDDFYPMLAQYDFNNGKRYSLPMSANNMQVIWNKDLFTAAGLDPETPPTTWTEMQAMAEQCSDPDNGVVGFEYYTQPTGEGITWQFQVWLWAAGGEFLNADNTAAAFNTPEGLEALTFVSDMLQGNGSVPGPWGAFGDGKACMQLDGSWLFGYRLDAPFEWGIAAVPAPDGGTTASNVGGERIIMFQSTENKEAAWQFIKFMTSTEIQLRWDRETGFLPVRASVGDDPDYLAWISDSEPRMMPFVEGMAHAHTRPATPFYNELSDAFSREIQAAFVGEATPADALAAAEKAVNDILNQ
jgi:multiple sugar transport system substrate-binding protein